MHMGGMAVIGANKPTNMIYVLINNGAHETAGGMPTMAESIELVAIAKPAGIRMPFPLIYLTNWKKHCRSQKEVVN